MAERQVTALYPFQTRAVEELRAAIVRDRSALYVLPTGGGKTVVAGEIARRASEKGARTILLVHRRELVKQSVETLRRFVPASFVGVEAAGWPRTPWAPLLVGSVQSVVRRANIQAPHLVIVDEAHHVRAKTWETVLHRWPNAAVVGLTATPERLDGKGLGAHFATMVLGPTMRELVDLDVLAPTRTLRVKSHFRRAGLKTGNGDYRTSDLADRVSDEVIADGVRAYQRYAPGRRAIFFGITIDHSRRVAEGLRAAGIRAEHVDGGDHAARRDRVFSELRTGGLDVVTNCDLVSEGFDAPGCDCVLLGRPTQSVTRYLQAAGRAMRFDRANPAKVALVLDLAGSSWDLGLPDEPREWSLEDGELREERKTKRRARPCPQCRTLGYGSPCRHCGYRATGREIREVDAELEVATERESEPRRGPRKPRMTRPEMRRLIREAKRKDDPLAALAQIAEANNYHPGWVDHVARAWRIGA